MRLRPRSRQHTAAAQQKLTHQRGKPHGKPACRCPRAAKRSPRVILVEEANSYTILTGCLTVNGLQAQKGEGARHKEAGAGGRVGRGGAAQPPSMVEQWQMTKENS